MCRTPGRGGYRRSGAREFGGCDDMKPAHNSACPSGQRAQDTVHCVRRDRRRSRIGLGSDTRRSRESTARGVLISRASTWELGSCAPWNRPYTRISRRRSWRQPNRTLSTSSGEPASLTCTEAADPCEILHECSRMLYRWRWLGLSVDQEAPSLRICASLSRANEAGRYTRTETRMRASGRKCLHT